MARPISKQPPEFPDAQTLIVPPGVPCVACGEELYPLALLTRKHDEDWLVCVACMARHLHDRQGTTP